MHMKPRRVKVPTRPHESERRRMMKREKTMAMRKWVRKSGKNPLRTKEMHRRMTQYGLSSYEEHGHRQLPLGTHYRRHVEESRWKADPRALRVPYVNRAEDRSRRYLQLQEKRMLRDPSMRETFRSYQDNQIASVKTPRIDMDWLALAEYKQKQQKSRSKTTRLEIS